jgi:hypothetical protein
VVDALLGLASLPLGGSLEFPLFALGSPASGGREVGSGEVEEDPRLVRKLCTVWCEHWITYGNASSQSSPHADRQELEADLVGRVHPPETFPGDVAEVGTLVTAESVSCCAGRL